MPSLLYLLDKSMSEDVNYKNNPLHGLGLKDLLTEIVDYYGFTILHAYLNINCFKTNPSIESSVKFLKKTEWARQKVEVFYLYQYKNLPRASSEQFALPPRDRIIPDHHKPGEPAELSIEDAERLQEKRERKAEERKKDIAKNKRSHSPYGSDNRGGRGRSTQGRYGSEERNSEKREAPKHNIYTDKPLSDDSATSEPPTPSESKQDNSGSSSDPWAKWK
jgi:uncharacterized protein (DUF2132 family)